MPNPTQTHIMSMLSLSIWVVVLFLLPVSVYAQEVDENESRKLTNDRTELLKVISGVISHSDNENWFVGKQYSFRHRKISGTPYFLDELEFKGNLVFNGEKYTNLALFYDLVTGDLVLNHVFKSGNSAYICLNDAWIEEFTLHSNYGSYHFLPASYFNPTAESVLPEGFVEVIHNNELKLLISYIKEHRSEVNESSRESFVLKKKLYIIKDNVAYEVTKKIEFISLFPHNKKQIRAFIRSLGNPYKNATRSDLISLIQMCEKLI